MWENISGNFYGHRQKIRSKLKSHQKAIAVLGQTNKTLYKLYRVKALP